MMTSNFELCVRALEIRGENKPSIMRDGGILIDEIGDELGQRRNTPVDLIDGPLFAAAVDARPLEAGVDSDVWLLHVLRTPAIIKRVSTSAEPLREGSDEQRRVAAQPEALTALAFHRPHGSGYSRSGAHRQPFHGTPVLCLDAVDYPTAPSPPFSL